MLAWRFQAAPSPRRHVAFDQVESVWPVHGSVLDRDKVYGFGRLPKYNLWTPALEFRLYAADREVKPASVQRALAGGDKLREQAGQRWIFNREITGKMSVEELSAADVRWSHDRPPLLVRAMALAGETLLVAGPPDALDEEAAITDRWSPAVQKQLAEQQAALDGRRGAALWAVSARDGKRLGELNLDAPPVFDGLAAARGRVYLAATDGTIRCFVER